MWRPKNVSTYIDMLCSQFLVLWDCRIQRLFENQVALNPGIGGVRDVASAIISHEKTQSNRVCCFQTLNTVFPGDLVLDYLASFIRIFGAFQMQIKT